MRFFPCLLHDQTAIQEETLSEIDRDSVVAALKRLQVGGVHTDHPAAPVQKRSAATATDCPGVIHQEMRPDIPEKTACD